MCRCSPTSAAAGYCATMKERRLPPNGCSGRCSACAPAGALTPTRRSCRPRKQRELAVGDERQAFFAADIVDDLQDALAIGAVLDAEFLHEAGIVDQVVAGQ